MPSQLFKDSRYLKIEQLFLSSNPIPDFRGLPTLECLSELYLDNTELASFTGAVPQPKLRILSFIQTPLADFTTHRLMAGVVFSGSLKRVNGADLTAAELKQSRELSDELRPYLIDGWTVMSLSPVKLLHSRTRARCTRYFPTSQIRDRAPKRLPRSLEQRRNETVPPDDGAAPMDLANSSPRIDARAKQQD